MTFADLLTDRGIVVPLEAPDLATALRDLMERLTPEGAAGAETTRQRKLARDLAFGSQGEVVRVHDSGVVVLGRADDGEGPRAALGVALRPFTVSAEGTEPRGHAQVVVLLLTSRRLSSLREDFVPTLVRVLREPGVMDRLVAAHTPGDVRGIRELMGAEFRERLLVEDALSPLRYRIYPDTPLGEVVGLMIRRELHAVPVVGENLEVLGIISVGDALQHLLGGRRKPQESGEGGVGGSDAASLAARDVMTRTVMCVSEDQGLLEAANLMANRDVEQLPVVREGELIGFLTRAAILRRLFGEWAAPARTDPQRTTKDPTEK